MRVLLTGDCGFVGRHLAVAMKERGWDVTGIDLRLGDDALDFFRTDNQRYDLAIHCAAIVGGRASIDGSPLGVATNLALDAWYMRWLIRTGTPRAVYFSSSAAYPVALQQPGPVRRLYEEDINLAYMQEPDATYGWAKLTGRSSPPTPRRKAAASSSRARSPGTAKTKRPATRSPRSSSGPSGGTIRSKSGAPAARRGTGSTSTTFAAPPSHCSTPT